MFVSYINTYLSDLYLSTFSVKGEMFKTDFSNDI